MRFLNLLCCAAAISVGVSSAHAALTPAIKLSGNVGLSVDGFGSNSASGGFLQAFIPIGATIERAFLYSAGTPFPFYADSPTTLAQYNAAGITLGGTAVTNFDTLVGATSSRPDIGGFFTARADVTSVVAALVAGSATPNFSFSISEGSLNNRIDGEVLAIAYSLPSLAEGSVIFLDGGQRTGGETTVVNFAEPLVDPTDPNFRAELGVGISFSCCSQRSTIQINGSTVSDFAGNFDDGAAQQDGSLITVGGLGDPALAFAGSYAEDKELYNIAPYLNAGDTSFSIFTSNATNDDNLFFASLYTTAIISDVGVPEPATWAMMLGGFGLLGGAARRKRAVSISYA